MEKYISVLSARYNARVATMKKPNIITIIDAFRAIPFFVFQCLMTNSMYLQI